MVELTRDESGPYSKQPTPKCAHYWIIEPPAGSVSLGVCQVCREVREFSNSIDEANRWDSEFGFANKPGSRNS